MSAPKDLVRVEDYTYTGIPFSVPQPDGPFRTSIHVGAFKLFYVNDEKYNFCIYRMQPPSGGFAYYTGGASIKEAADTVRHATRNDVLPMDETWEIQLVREGDEGTNEEWRKLLLKNDLVLVHKN